STASRLGYTEQLPSGIFRHNFRFGVIFDSSNPLRVSRGENDASIETLSEDLVRELFSSDEL
ncbi:MAG: hypothetical protein K0U13_00840, partial [Chlamydiae bacterium]|nr:hypothetical protein [Chlamydiota bacterium]